MYIDTGQLIIFYDLNKVIKIGRGGILEVLTLSIYYILCRANSLKPHIMHVVIII